MRPARIAVALAGLSLAGCGHTDALRHDVVLAGGPFAGATPTRLTYSLDSDVIGDWSSDGRHIVYGFDRIGPDHDRCLGIIPAAGGTRTAEICESRLGHEATRDGFDQAALDSDGKLVYTYHRGLPGDNPTSDVAEVHLTRLGSAAPPRLLLTLLGTPAGGSARWDDLREPLWAGEQAILALGAQRHIVAPTCPKGCSSDPVRWRHRDTVIVGVDLVRLVIPASGPATIHRIAPAPNAVTWSWDRSSDQAWLVAQTPAPGDDVYREPVADTLFRVSVSGGTPEPVMGWPRPDRPRTEHLDGVAAGRGRVFLSLSSGVADSLVSQIVELETTGDLRPIATAPGWRWNRIRLSPDGRHLLAELETITHLNATHTRSTTDLYRLDVAR